MSYTLRIIMLSLVLVCCQRDNEPSSLRTPIRYVAPKMYPFADSFDDYMAGTCLICKGLSNDALGDRSGYFSEYDEQGRWYSGVRNIQRYTYTEGNRVYEVETEAIVHQSPEFNEMLKRRMKRIKAQIEAESAAKKTGS